MQQAVAATVNGGSAGVVPTKAPTYYEVPNEFRFVAYSTPPKANVGMASYIGNDDYNTVDNWITMEECGFNYTHPIYYEESDEDYERCFANAERSGMKVFLPSSDYSVNPIGLAGVIKSSSKKGWTYQDAWNKIIAMENDIKARYDKFTKYDSFAGIYASDEPNATQYPAIAAAQDWFEINYPEYEFYVNLLPPYANGDQLHGNLLGKEGYKDYEDHIERYSEIVNPYVMSMDHYPLVQAGVVDSFFFAQFVCAYNAKQLEKQFGWEVPYHVYLQTMAFGDRISLTDKTHWTWQAYNSLAFGATGLYVFNYWPLMSDRDGADGTTGNLIGDGVVTRSGEKTDLYYWIQDNLTDLKAFEDTYMSYNWVNTAGVGTGALISKLASSTYYDSGISNIARVNANTDVLIGEFDSRTVAGRKGYLISNATSIIGNTTTSASVTINFASASRVKVHNIDGRTANEQAVSGNQLSLTIPAGAGFFVEVLA